MFKALVIDKDDNGQTVTLKELSEDQIPDGDVTIRVLCSTLNYKDALAITGKGPVVRKFPMVPGIDFVGEVRESDHPEWSPGDRVILNGWGVGETHWGGHAELARVKGDWLVPLPAEFTPVQAMGIGTAGYTAMLCVMALERNGVTPASGEVLVTGAAGGVGSVAIAILSKLGYDVVAMTGRQSEEAYLKSLGASRIIDRAEYTEPGKPLLRETWAGAVDVVGGQVLANVCAAMRYRGTVAACGLAGGMGLPATVAPFILRGVTLVGIDSVMCPQPERREAWRRLASDLDPAHLEAMTQTIAISDLEQAAHRMIDGSIRGRIVTAFE